MGWEMERLEVGKVLIVAAAGTHRQESTGSH